MTRYAAAVFILLLSQSCAFRAPKNTIAREGSIERPMLLGTRSASIFYANGQSSLNEMNKHELKELASKAAREGHQIAVYRVLAWSDKEYPEISEVPDPKDIKLAKKRGRNIKKYLTHELNAQERVQIFNMAERPSYLSRALESNEWIVKESFEKTGATISRLPGGKLSYTKASKALVIVEFKDDE